MNVRNLLTVLALALVAGLTTAPALADDKDHDKKHEHEHAKKGAPKNIGEAMQAVHHHADQIKKLIDAGKLGEVHGPVESLMNTAKSLGKLAVAKDSGVAKENVKEVNRLSKELATAAHELHEAADANKAAETKAAQEKVTQSIAALDKLVPHSDEHEEHEHKDKK